LDVCVECSVKLDRNGRSWKKVACKPQTRDIFRWGTYRFADSPICDQCKPSFNLALNGDRSAPLVDASRTRKEREMNRRAKTGAERFGEAHAICCLTRNGVTLLGFACRRVSASVR